MSNHSDSSKWKKPKESSRIELPMKDLKETIISEKIDKTSSRAISHATSRTKDTVPKLIKNCKSQEDNLDFRLMNRKRQKFNQTLRNFQSNSSFETCSSEHLSNSVDYCKLTERIEASFEVIMERNCLAKATKIAEIQVNYNSAIRALEDTDNPDHIQISNLKASLKAEISMTSQQYKESLQEELDYFKKNLL